MRISVTQTILTVTACSILGMVLGGAFGYATGVIAPALFEYPFPPWNRVEPLPAAIVLGASGGVFCGGALGAFAVFVQLIHQWIQGSSGVRGTPSERPTDSKPLES